MRINETLIINIEYRIDRDIDTERHGEAQSSELRAQRDTKRTNPVHLSNPLFALSFVSFKVWREVCSFSHNRCTTVFHCRSLYFTVDHLCVFLCISVYHCVITS